MRVVQIKPICGIARGHVKAVVVWCFQEQLREYSVKEINWLMCECDACPNAYEDYF
jgi:hypothetical protein